ncbi:MAG: hypothetical protein R3B81_05185 [bacterium]
MRTSAIALAVLGILVGLAPGSARAENRLELARYGARIGFSLTPDQFVAGFYGDFGEVAPSLTFRPSADLGIGNSLFTIVVNGDFQYSLRTPDLPAYPYVGAGLGLGYYTADGGGDDTGIGLNLYVGAERSLGDLNSAHGEIRFGVGDIPDVKIVVGMGFY